jgi:hypothetical protein
MWSASGSLGDVVETRPGRGLNRRDFGLESLPAMEAFLPIAKLYPR